MFATSCLAQVDVTATGGTLNTSYTTLKGAFDAINAGTHTGTITIGISGNTTETAPAVLNASGAGSASYSTIGISPTGNAARTISGAISAGSPLIDFNGADNVTIDGLNAGGNSLTLANTTVSDTPNTSTIRFIYGATGNKITNAVIQGSFSGGVTANGGTIYFSIDNVTVNGNDDNTISNCDIGPAGTNLPTKGVCNFGSTYSTGNYNSGIVINNNNIFDYFAGAGPSAGIYFNIGTTDCSITNNRFYQTSSRTLTTNAQHSAIWIVSTSGNKFLVNGNTIGFASSAGTGTYTFVGSTGSTLIPMYLSVGNTSATNVQGNTIAGIAMSGSSSGTSSSAPFRGIYIHSGLVTTGDVTGNTIGSQSATSSITYTSSSTSSSEVIGMFNYGSSTTTWTVNNNTIGGIKASNSSTGAANVTGIRFNTTSSSTTTVQNNLIGGTVANSLQSTSTAAGSQVVGIYSSTSMGTITGNTIRNLTAAGGTNTTTSASVVGMAFVSTSVNNTVSQNTIHTLTNTHGSAATIITGIQYTSSTGTNLISRNFLHSFAAASSAAILNGIQISGGTATYQNNMIRLGVDASGSSIITALTINGINELAGTTVINNFWFNSICIGGSGVGTAASNTFAFNSAVVTNTRAVQNNLFVNTRSNATTGGKHYAIKVGGTTSAPTGLTLNYNDYLVTGTGGVFGSYNGADVANLAAWKTSPLVSGNGPGLDSNSYNLNPQFLTPNGTSATVDLHINPSVTSVAEGNGWPISAVTDDFDGQARSGLTPVDLGADAGNFLGFDLAPPIITYTALGNTTSTGVRTLIATITDVTGVPASGSGLPVL